jgi:hypothetical protein
LIKFIEPIISSFEDKKINISISNYEPLKLNLELQYDTNISGLMLHKNMEQFLLTNAEISEQFKNYETVREDLNLKTNLLSKKISENKYFSQIFYTTFGKEAFNEQYVFYPQFGITFETADKIYDRVSEITGFNIDEITKSTLKISTFTTTQICNWNFHSGDGKLGKFWEKYKKMYQRVEEDLEILQLASELNINVENTKNLLSGLREELKKKRHELSIKYGVPYSRS